MAIIYVRPSLEFNQRKAEELYLYKILQTLKNLNSQEFDLIKEEFEVMNLIPNGALAKIWPHRLWKQKPCPQNSNRKQKQGCVLPNVIYLPVKHGYRRRPHCLYLVSISLI
jgi:hypothetical protein